MLLNANDLFEIVKITLVLFASAFSLYLPLLLWLKEKNLALKLTIPVSFSIQIIFGYVFYCVSKISIYPLYYLALIVAANLISIYFLRPKFKLAKPKLKMFPTILGVGLAIAVMYHFFADALSTYAPGTIDTVHHISYLFDDLKSIGYLNFPTYPAGFHILLYPLTFFNTEVPVYRFTGPILGLLSLSALIFAVKDLFKNRIMTLALIAMIISPFFNQLILQLIGFFPTSLSFIFLSLVLIILMERTLKVWPRVFFILLVASAIGLTIPYLTVQLIPVLLGTLIYNFFIYRKTDPDNSKRIWLVTCGVILSFAIAFGHVYLQGSVLKRTFGFPAIETVALEKGDLTTKTTYEPELGWFGKKITSLNYSPKVNELVQAYIKPMLVTGHDILKLKNIRPFNSVISIGAYAILTMALLALYLRRRDANLSLLAIMILVFGISTQTGILEISTYRGRSGFYLLFLAPIFIIFFVDKIYRTKFYKWMVAAILLALAGSFINPPSYYRDYYQEYYTVAEKILNDWPNKNITLVTTRKELKIFSKHFAIYPLKQDIALNTCSSDKCFLILENKYLVVDPILSQRAYALDKNGQAYNILQEKAARDQDGLTERIRSELPDDTKVYFKNENIVVYELTNR